MTGERLYASLAAEEAERLECCRFAVGIAHRKYDMGAALSETEAGLDARTVYITLSRRAGVSIPTPPPSAMESPAASTPPERESDTSKSEPRLSGEASPVSVAAKSGGVEPPQQSPEGMWYFTCVTCGKRQKWIRRGAMPEKPMPGAVCFDCWKEANPR